MINAIQPTTAIKETSLDELQLETKKERFALLAEQFRAEFSSNKEDNSSIESKANKDRLAENKAPEKNEQKK